MIPFFQHALRAISDGLIALSCIPIPAALLVLIRRRGPFAFRWAYLLFGVFTLACGTICALALVAPWPLVPELESIVKAVTALATMATTALLLRLVAEAMAYWGPAQLTTEIEDGRRAEEQVRLLNAELEAKVRERTLQLAVEKAANAQRTELAAALDKTQAIIQKLDGTILYWSSGSEWLFGWSRAEAMGRKSHELLQTELPCPFEQIQAQLLERGSWRGEFKQRRRDGSSVWVASDWALHRNAEGEPVSVAKVNNDITELKHAGELLRKSEATVRSLFDNASQGILTADREGRIVDVNAMVQQLFEYSRAELIGVPVEVLLPERLRNRFLHHVAGYVRQSRSGPAEGQGRDLAGRRKDGSEFSIEVGLSCVAEDGSGPQTMAFISDTTERQRASREREALISILESALSEKTVLVKEVHHRVKNNLAVIAGLLAVQADAVADRQANIALEESQQRVLSMALIHEYLYATEHLDRVNFGEYLQQLANKLCISYAIKPDLVGVRVDTEDIELPVDRAIPCGLILNELLSNALKYGFPDGRRGQIGVNFARHESGGLSLSCQDDGVGIPENMDWQNPKSLGLRLVGILTKQIDGQLTLDRSGAGTRFELTFPAA
jgi:PAS domain S-box-containing protein